MPFPAPENKIGCGCGLNWKELKGPEVLVLSSDFPAFALLTGENTCDWSVDLAFHAMKTF